MAVYFTLAIALTAIATRDTVRADTLETVRGAPAITAAAFRADSEPQQKRRRAVEYSDWYARRLAIHRVASYTMLPLFATMYIAGDKLMSGNAASWVKPTHQTLAFGTAALFGVNTITGAWNLYDSRHDPAGRTRRFVHAALLLASDAGFAYTGAIAGDAKDSPSGRDRHRAAALTSMGIATVGTALMWFWKN